ncbi:hypothetical protein A1D31_12245 [Bradyrhizobium liaoningense]|nr:hypothetical protein A1D31_12245 [Bradyrhizobium liaoningense]
MPPDPNELLRRADETAADSGATETNLRRAVSDAYYALFHFTLQAAADKVVGAASSSSAIYELVYRSIDHKAFAALCKTISTQPTKVIGLPASGLGEVGDYAGIVASLYEQRILADYSTVCPYTATQVQLHISNARQAISWFQAASSERRECFLINLLFKAR